MTLSDACRPTPTSREFLLTRLSLFFELRWYLVFAFLATALLALVYRQPAYLLGYVAFFPYLVFNLLAAKEDAGTLATYHGFPFMLALIWPVYEALSKRLFKNEGESAESIGGDTAGRSVRSTLKTSGLRQLSVVLAIILVCVSTTLIEPRSTKALYWRDLPKTEKRYATQGSDVSLL